MSSENPSDPRPDSQVEAEQAAAAEEIREITEAEGPGRDAEAASAAAYAEAGIMGAPGSEVTVAAPARAERQKGPRDS